MSEITQLLAAAERGDARAAEDLLPIVYDELRRLAAQRLAHEKPGQTLQATALVHEAYLRLIGSPSPPGAAGELKFENTGHFFAAAAEAMRRILIDQARRKGRAKHGGNRRRVKFDEAIHVANDDCGTLLAVDQALERFQQIDPDAAALVKLRYYAGLSMADAAKALGLSLRTAERNWTYARTWLHRELSSKD
jgi:RNA polymerase sigma factor (TIGR02999 family)